MMNHTTNDQLRQHFQKLDQLRQAITLTLETLQRTLAAADGEINAVRALIEGEHRGAQA